MEVLSVNTISRSCISLHTPPDIQKSCLCIIADAHGVYHGYLLSISYHLFEVAQMR